MYKCDKPDTEEYLLGRRIDKHVDDPKADDEANKGNCSIFFVGKPDSSTWDYTGILDWYASVQLVTGTGVDTALGEVLKRDY